MANVEETRKKILDHFEKNNWSIPDVAFTLNISEQYLRRILKYPNDHVKQITDIVAYYKIR